MTIQPDSDKWRPAQWQGRDEQWTPAEVAEFHASHVKKGWVTKKGILLDGCPPNRAAQVEVLAHDHALLRDCWNTPRFVWDIVEMFFGGPIETDPFWNPWGSLHPETKLDGSPGNDGFAVGKLETKPGEFEHYPKHWRGRVGANGPHSATSHTPDVPEGSSEEYAKGGWLRYCSDYGRAEQCAAVVPQRGDDALWHHGYTCDLVLDFGRINFDSPPGVPSSSNPGTTVALLWLPDRECSAPARRLFEQGSYRLERPSARASKRTGRKTREVLVRPGVPRYNPKTDNLLRLTT